MSSAAPSRGVVYVVWGRARNPGLQAVLQRSMDSVKKVHPELPVTVCDLPEGASLLDKPKMYKLSPYEETLYLDIDTVVLSRLDMGFEKSAKHHLACVICEAAYARRYENSVKGDTVEYNTGVLFFRKGEPCEKLFARWAALAKSVDSSMRFFDGQQVRGMPFNDQAGFALAVEEAGLSPFVLPHNWNLRPRWTTTVHGPVKVWHDYDPVPPRMAEFWKTQEQGLLHFSLVQSLNG